MTIVLIHKTLLQVVDAKTRLVHIGVEMLNTYVPSVIDH